MSKTIKSTALHLQPLPEYRTGRPVTEPHREPPAIHYGPALPAHIQAARDQLAEQHRQDAIDRAVENLRVQFGAGTVLVSR